MMLCIKYISNYVTTFNVPRNNNKLFILWLSFEPLIDFMDMYVCIMMHDDILNNFNLGLHDEFRNYMTTKVMVNGKITSARIYLKG